jgi:predicted MPP superfamily phosphohydrolase
VHIKKTKKDDVECQLVIVFFGWKETKQNKTTTSTSSSSSSLSAKKQNKKMMTSVDAHCRFLYLMKKKKTFEKNVFAF